MLLGVLNPIAWQFGGLEIHWYGIIIACGVLLATYLAVKEAQRRNISEDTILDLILWALPFSLIGARFYYVVFQWPYYAAHPDQIIQIWHGGIAIYGGLIAAAIVFIVYCYYHHLPIWLILDIAAPAVVIAQAIGRWGNFMNQEAYGTVTTYAYLHSFHLPHVVIAQMFINGAYRQPTFLYESIWNVIGFVLIMTIRHNPHWFKQGEIFLSYVMWYSFARFFIEGMRTDSLMIGNFLRVSQILSVVFFVGAAIILVIRRRQNKLQWYLDGNPVMRSDNNE